MDDNKGYLGIYGFPLFVAFVFFFFIPSGDIQCREHSLGFNRSFQIDEEIAELKVLVGMDLAGSSIEEIIRKIFGPDVEVELFRDGNVPGGAAFKEKKEVLVYIFPKQADSIQFFYSIISKMVQTGFRQSQELNYPDASLLLFDPHGVRCVLNSKDTHFLMIRSEPKQRNLGIDQPILPPPPAGGSFTDRPAGIPLPLAAFIFLILLSLVLVLIILRIRHLRSVTQTSWPALVLEHSGQKYELDRDEFLLGRTDECHLNLPDSSVSRKHAVLQRSDSGYSIQNLSETNPITVNGQQVSCMILLPGDRIQIGSYTFIFTE